MQIMSVLWEMLGPTLNFVIIASSGIHDFEFHRLAATAWNF